MQHLESGVVWGIVLLGAGVLLVLDALGLDIVDTAFWGILLLVAGAFSAAPGVGRWGSPLRLGSSAYQAPYPNVLPRPARLL